MDTIKPKEFRCAESFVQKIIVPAARLESNKGEFVAYIKCEFVENV